MPAVSKQTKSALTDWLTSLAPASGAIVPGKSAEELSAEAGKSVKWVLQQLKPLMAAGKVTVAFRDSTSLIGRKTRTPVYRFTK